MLLDTWLELSRNGLHLHPFGNLVTNTDARREIETLMGIEKLWFVFRLGYTEPPEKSMRLSMERIVV